MALTAPPIPAPTYYWDIEQGTDEWHDLRRGLITASAIDCLLTAGGKPASNETSRKALYKLLGERLTGESDDSASTFDMARGHLLEPYARDIYAQRFGPVVECGFIVATLGNVQIGYSPDGLVGDDGLIEIKSPRAKKHLLSLLTDTVPAEYISQVQTGLAVSGRRWCDFISYCPGLPLFVQRCRRDENRIAQLITAAQAAEEQLAGMLTLYQEVALKFPATEPLAPESSDEINL